MTYFIDFFCQKIYANEKFLCMNSIDIYLKPYDVLYAN